MFGQDLMEFGRLGKRFDAEYSFRVEVAFGKVNGQPAW